MNPVRLIARKRDGGRLEPDELRAFVTAYARGDVPDYQMAAMAMAIFLRGLDEGETAALVAAMLDSGEVLVWPRGERLYVDKHSTGGIGDKTSLILSPLLAAEGLRVPMISGRGLGPTGGTLDKLESIPGFRAQLELPEFRRVVHDVGCVIAGATATLVPADRKLYALRDVTATVPSIPLITASIMSKKLAEGLDALVLDVKHGSGAFMKRLDDGRRLARGLVDVGRRMGVRTSALLTDMNQPLGRMIGNAVEVDESLDVLEGGGPADLVELTLALGAELLVDLGRAATAAEGREALRRKLASGEAREVFGRMVAAQGGDLDAPRPRAEPHEIAAPRDGYLSSIDVERLGYAVIELGGGRKQLTDRIDFGVGLEMLARLGERVERGQPLVRVFARPAHRQAADALLAESLHLADAPIPPPPLIVETLR